MGFRVLADGQAVHEPFLEVRLVILQHRLQRVVQKLYVLFQLYKSLRVMAAYRFSFMQRRYLAESK